MYEEPNMTIWLFSTDDIVRMSKTFEGDWKDENVDDDGWT